jgi:hypothetical protein
VPSLRCTRYNEPFLLVPRVQRERASEASLDLLDLKDLLALAMRGARAPLGLQAHQGPPRSPDLTGRVSLQEGGVLGRAMSSSALWAACVTRGSYFGFCLAAVSIPGPPGPPGAMGTSSGVSIQLSDSGMDPRRQLPS